MGFRGTSGKEVRRRSVPEFGFRGKEKRDGCGHEGGGGRTSKEEVGERGSFKEEAELLV